MKLSNIATADPPVSIECILYRNSASHLNEIIQMICDSMILNPDIEILLCETIDDKMNHWIIRKSITDEIEQQN